MTLAITANGPANSAAPMLEMNMTPLIDVMLVMIIMLIITIPRQQHALNLQVGGATDSRERPPAVTIDIDFDGTVSWNGAVVPTRGELETKMAGVVAGDPATSVQLRPNKLVDYRSVAGVLAVAQRARVANLGVIGHEQFL